MSKLEQTGSKEVLAREPRFIVFGTNGAGSQEIAEGLKEAVKDLANSQVDVVHNIAGIEDMFYGRYGEPTREVHYKGGLPRRLGAAMLGRKPKIAKWTQTPVRKQGPDTLPQAVVVLPEMRFRDAAGDTMTVPTPSERIQELCEQNGVSMNLIEAQPSSERIAELASQVTAR